MSLKDKEIVILNNNDSILESKFNSEDVKKAVLKLKNRLSSDLKLINEIDSETQIYNTLDNLERIFGDFEQ